MWGVGGFGDVEEKEIEKRTVTFLAMVRFGFRVIGILAAHFGRVFRGVNQPTTYFLPFVYGIGQTFFLECGIDDGGERDHLRKLWWSISPILTGWGLGLDSLFERIDYVWCVYRYRVFGRI